MDYDEFFIFRFIVYAHNLEKVSNQTKPKKRQQIKIKVWINYFMTDFPIT